jgi:hypothetical protein
MVRAVPFGVRVSRLLCLLSVALGPLSGCDDLQDFHGTYAGHIVKGSFVRSCFCDTVCAILEFDPDRAVANDAGTGAPNTLTTSDMVFQGTVLEPVRGLANDHLSLLDFPGPQRLRNYLLVARPSSGPLAGRDAFVVVSLLASEDVEVRVTARSADGTAMCAAEADLFTDGADGDVSEPREYFGLFRMRRSSGDECSRSSSGDECSRN